MFHHDKNHDDSEHSKLIDDLIIYLILSWYLQVIELENNNKHLTPNKRTQMQFSNSFGGVCTMPDHWFI